jgi:putative transposase
MARRKRHSPAEIEPKLEKANALAANGHTQVDIARVLGISVMTLHRWRKSRQLSHPSPTESVTSDVAILRVPTARQDQRITELELENSRLRRLVTNLLLEKMRLEEDARSESKGQTGVRERDDRDQLVATR